jgi:uncharacterized membrane protein
MEAVVLLIIFAVCCILSGPIALVISIVALKRTKETAGYTKSEPQKELFARPVFEKEIKAPPVIEKPAYQAAAAPKPQEMPTQAQESSRPAIEQNKSVIKEKAGTLEQKIGTRWILIAGVITVIVGVGFFLKYAYDNNLIGPLGRVIITAILGLMALAVGEITRRRGYGIVAKGVTALGFAILYAAVFSAYRFYGLIGSIPAFALSIFVTAAAMLYAVALDEIVIAFLCLLGGFLTPVIVSTGENLPMPLFGYILILGIGAMLCAYYRKWRAINLLAFAGTIVLYAGWFEKFYRPTMSAMETPKQIGTALGWLGVFFAVYLVLPILHEMIKKVKAQREDVLLVLVNAATTFYYLWTILFTKYRTELAFCAVGLCASHLIINAIVIKRCRDDVNLRLSLLAIGLFFLTIAVPLYLKMYAVSIAWSAEGIVLIVIGLRYKSIWTRIGGIAALILSLGQLLQQLPMHTAAFGLVFNPAFGSWCFVAAALLVCHLIYRKPSAAAEDQRNILSQVLYGAACLLLFAAAAMEWYWNCNYNIAPSQSFAEALYIKGLMILFAIFILPFIIRPICPKGKLCIIMATILAAAGSTFTMTSFIKVYESSFTIFANVNFAIALLPVAVLLKKTAKEEKGNIIFPAIMTLMGIFVLWILLSEEIYLYWQCRQRYIGGTENWQFLANMYISVMWSIYGAALMIMGFWRKNRMLRYIALGLFGLLLVKVFIIDMETVKSVYRIATFLATGITLVAVSYIYQFLKKKGFFAAALTEKTPDK